MAILADDLIWATRLADAVTAAGGTAIRLRRLEDLAGRLGGSPSAPTPEATAAAAGSQPAASHAIIDLTARAYDGVEAIRRATAAGARVVAVGQHDDVELRRRALEAGAERVFTYRALFENGSGTIATWLGR
ncbi:MAG TPA: hypothetical protein VM451_07605 [Candidatus Limnocylindria bacterium]|nr:hypothetical protein [Candidatus Limnocylindria bacterium]